MTITRAQVIKNRLDQLGDCSDLEDALCREFGSKASSKANQMVVQWMTESGLDARVDHIGNVRGVRNNGRSKVFLMGSHLDTVTNAGKFDGPLGVLLAIDQALHIDHNKFTYDFEAVGFSNEEGLRYHHCYLGSHALCGSFQESWLATEDRNGIMLADAIREMGGDPSRVSGERLTNAQVAGYLEVHMEQGPVLEREGYPVGVVAGIAGQQRYMVSVTGAPGHAGTVPMVVRQDALTGASAAILAIEKLGRSIQGMVATAGWLEVVQGASNVIPAKVMFTLDIRHGDADCLNTAVQQLTHEFQKISQERNLLIELEKVFEEQPVKCNQQLTHQLSESIKNRGYPVQSLFSGAGHDASVVSAIAPICMLFVRCKHGISHSPLEDVSLEDIAAAIDVCDSFFQDL